MSYDYDVEYYGDVPTGNYWDKVLRYNPWEPNWSQEEYEHRMNTEAELMIALEALKESLLHLDWDVDDLEDKLNENRSDLSECENDIWKCQQDNEEFAHHMD